jgi:hypothetical protein
MVTSEGQTGFEFEHINLNQIDPGYKPIDENVYNYEVQSLKPTYVKINKPTSPYAGQEVLVLKGSFTVVDDDNFSGKKVWYDFWTTNKYNLIELRKLKDATGVEQLDNQSLVEWANSFATLNPSAKFQCFTTKEDDRNGVPRNVIKFMQARSV